VGNEDLFPADNVDHALVGMKDMDHVVDTMGMDHVAGMMDNLVGNLGTKGMTDKKDTREAVLTDMNSISPHIERCNNILLIDTQKVFSSNQI
jgi:hypothetical protein